MCSSAGSPSKQKRDSFQFNRKESLFFIVFQVKSAYPEVSQPPSAPILF